MQIKEVTGIILQETAYQENSKILQILTKEFGKIGVISKGCRSMKSKLRSVSSKMTYATFNIYYKEEGLSTLINADIIDEFSNIKQDLSRISYSTYLLDLTNQVIKETYTIDIFNILVSALIKINQNFTENIILSIVELKYLEYLGVKPCIDSCVICGSDKSIITISGDRGGFICKSCYKNDYIVDEKTIKLLRMFYYVDIAKISELNINKKNINEISKFIDIYYDRYTGLYLKSKEFLKKIEQFN